MKTRVFFLLLPLLLVDSCSYKNDQKMKNQSFAIINQFEVPQTSESEFLNFFSSHIKLINSQQGIVECRLFKANGTENVLNYISIVRWQNEKMAKKAKDKIDSATQKAGIDIKEFQEKHNIKVVNRSFSEIPVL